MKRHPSLRALLALSALPLAATAAELAIPPRSHVVLIEAATTDIPLRDLKLREAGLAPGGYFQEADEIRVFRSKAVMNESPEARIWLNARQTNAYWFHTGGEGSAEGYLVRSNAAVVIVTRGSSNTVVVAKP